MTEDLNGTENVQAAEYMAELAVGGPEQCDHVEGFVPALPSGMEERIVANGHAAMNGKGEYGSHDVEPGD